MRQAEPALPFEEALVPLVEQARRTLTLSALDGVDGLDPLLLRPLSFVAAPTLFEAFTAMRDARWPIPQLRPPGRAAYAAFVEDLGAWDAIHVRWPGLRPLVDRVIEQWRASVMELDGRLSADLPRLRETLEIEGAVTAVEGPLSDRHHDGRTVVRLRFSTGASVIYKPRSVHLEAAWSQLLPHLPGALHAPVVVPRGDYGWMEDVPAAPLETVEAARRYHHRLGVLLCAAYTLEATDLHFGNLVAHGEHPVIVDLEAVLSARSADLFPPDPDPAVAAAHARLWHSVLRTRLLPRWRADDGRAWDLSPLGALEEQSTGRLVPAWRDCNTDRMDLEWRPAVARPRDNVPRLDGRPLPPQAFVEDIIAGFDAAHACMPPDLAPFLGAVSRLLVRSTPVYQAALADSVSPEALATHDGRTAVLRRLTDATAKSEAWRTLAEEEQAALERLDIPWFGVPVDGVTLGFRAPAVARVQRDDPAFQRMLIRLALRAGDGRLGLGREGLVAALEQHAIRDGEHVTWVGLERLGAGPACDVGPLEARTRLRLAHILARHARVRGDQEAEALARCAARQALGDVAPRAALPVLEKACAPRPLRRLRRDPLRFLTEMSMQGDVAHAEIEGRHLFLVSSPQLAREVLIQRAETLHKGHGVGVGRPATDEGRHVEWLHALAPALRQLLAPTPRIPSTGGRLDARRVMSDASLEAIGEVLFGEAFASGRELARAYADRVVNGLPPPLGGLEARLPMAADFPAVEAAFTHWVNAVTVSETTLLARIRALGDGQGPESAVLIAEVTRLLLLAGHETVATLLTWTLLLLAAHPQPDDVDDIAILSEAMRLYPPVWCIGRRALAETRVGDRTVPAGAQVVVSPWVLHRDGRWFDRPLEFQPRRWPEASRKAFLPFGLGPRRCLGEAFAWQYAAATLGELRRRFRFGLVDPSPPAPVPLYALQPPRCVLLDFIPLEKNTCR